MSEEVKDELQKLIWNHGEKISLHEEKKRFDVVREFLKTRNLNPMNLTKVFKGADEEKHLTMVSIVSKLAVSEFQRN
jgi:hypothetical protein